jgi:hypothetical protein
LVNFPFLSSLRGGFAAKLIAVDLCCELDFNFITHLVGEIKFMLNPLFFSVSFGDAVSPLFLVVFSHHVLAFFQPCPSRFGCFPGPTRCLRGLRVLRPGLGRLDAAAADAHRAGGGGLRGGGEDACLVRKPGW